MTIRRLAPFAPALALFALAAGCARSERAAEAPPADGAPVLQTDRAQRTLEDCPEHLAPCASITLEYVRVARGADGLKAAVRAFLDTTVFAPVDERATPGGAAAADSLMARFLDGYREFMESFPEAPGAWSIRRTARPIWNESGVVSLEFVEESYTGGAHPNTETRLASFDAGSGRRLGLADLFASGYEQPLLALGEKAFREAHGLAPGDDLVSAGFWFADGRFTLTDNFAVVGEGLRFHYNAYEVAPYATGPTDLTLPREVLARLARPGGPLSAAPPS